MEHIVTSIANVSWPECFASLSSNAKAYLIDVRTQEEWKETGIADLGEAKKSQVKLISWMLLKPYTHINSNFLSILMKEIDDKQADLYFVCRSGGRSLKAAEAALQAGYQNCYNLNDGFVDSILRGKL
jgi:rhodanese-related sulfurtransferase